MAIAKAVGVESVRFSAPDLGAMRTFLLDFGLKDAECGVDNMLRMRGAGEAPFIHETVAGPAGFVGLSMRVGDVRDLEALAAVEGVEVKPSRAPGGGFSVMMRDPDGYAVEAIAGRTSVPTAAVSRTLWNAFDHQERGNAPKRIGAGAAKVVRLGHVVLGVSDIKRTWEWWQARFGLLVSDEVRAPTGDLAALFIRCDRGKQPVDHHTLNFASIPGVPPKFHHAAFEVVDLDDLMAGNRFLADRGYLHDWGVGRHILGSQVFDYWKDPWGHRVEHWTDGDRFDAGVAVNVTDIPTMLGHQWGPDAPPDFAV